MLKVGIEKQSQSRKEKKFESTHQTHSPCHETEIIL
jgi:hypothetical protein